MVDISILTMVYIPTNITGGAPPCVGYLSVFPQPFPTWRDRCISPQVRRRESGAGSAALRDGNQRCRFPIGWLINGMIDGIPMIDGRYPLVMTNIAIENCHL